MVGVRLVCTLRRDRLFDRADSAAPQWKKPVMSSTPMTFWWRLLHGG